MLLKIKRFAKRIRGFLFKTYYMVKETRKPIIKKESNRLNLIWWNEKKNLGDYLSFVVYDWMTRKYSLDKDRSFRKTRYLMAVGSVISFSTEDATIWGSGVLSVQQIPVLFRKAYYRKLDVRAVRGPFTRHVLISAGYKCPEVYGDPAILMPLVYQPKKEEKKYKVSIVEHFSKKKQIGHSELNRIDIETNDYKYFVDEICFSKKVISSSLHGIILAEAYGVPAVFLSDGMEKQMFKFWDWYLSTGRTDIRMAKTLEEALVMEPMPLPQLDEMRDNLIKCFPVDLWKED